MQYAGALRIAGMADSVVTHEPYLATHRQDYGPTVLYRTLAGQFVLGRDYAKALKVQRLIKEEYARVLQDVDFSLRQPHPSLPGVLTRKRSPWVVRRIPCADRGRHDRPMHQSQYHHRVTRYVDSLWVHARRSPYWPPAHWAPV